MSYKGKWIVQLGSVSHSLYNVLLHFAVPTFKINLCYICKNPTAITREGEGEGLQQKLTTSMEITPSYTLELSVRGSSSTVCRDRSKKTPKTRWCLLLWWPPAKRSQSPAVTALRAAGSAAPAHPGAKLTNSSGALVINRGDLQVPAEVLPLREKVGWQG